MRRAIVLFKTEYSAPTSHALQESRRDHFSVSEAVSEIPEYFMVRKSVSVKEKMSSSSAKSLSKELEKVIGKDSTAETKFGVRVSSDDSWVLVRESGTEPVIRITTESKHRSKANRIMKETLSLVKRVLTGRA